MSSLGLGVLPQVWSPGYTMEGVAGKAPAHQEHQGAGGGGVSEAGDGAAARDGVGRFGSGSG